MRSRACRIALLSALLPWQACAPPQQEADVRLKVEVLVVARAAIDERLELQARLTPPPELDRVVAPQVAGRLTKVRVRPGQNVAAGALLAVVDDRALREVERTAEAELSKALAEESARQRVADLTRSLFDKGIVAAEERDADLAAAAGAVAARVSAEGGLAAARREASWARVVAPFNGVVVELLRHEGESVDGSPATPILRFAGLAQTEAEARATAAEIARLTLGAAAAVEVAGHSVPAHLTRVAAAVDPSSGLGEVRARLEAPAGAPLFADALLAIVVAHHPQAVAIPVSAVRRSEAGTDEVVVVSGGIATARPVRLGARDGELVEVLAGLEPGERIAAAPLGLADGTPVEAVAASQGAGT